MPGSSLELRAVKRVNKQQEGEATNPYVLSTTTEPY